VRAENDLLEPVSTGQKPRSACITVKVARLSQILRSLFRVPSTAHENEGRAVLYSSNPALSGHRHVPYVNNVSNTLIVHCGTVSSTRVRGFMRPSYNRIELDGDEIHITLRYPGEGEEPLASGSWRPVANIVFHPPYERYVRYDRLPF
jgi:predicted phosphodiesterase